MILSSEEEARAWLSTLPEGDPAARSRLERLAELLRAENEKQNLVSAASLEQVWVRHIADSAQLLQHVSRETSGPWLDLGTGAGFPGLVISALRPELRVLMVELRPRRTEWLESARKEIGLGSAEIFCGRLEALPSSVFGVISARAFAPLPRLVDLSARFSTPDTAWVLPKGRSAAQELSKLSGWEHTFHVEQSLTDADAGVIVGRLLGKSPKRKGKRL